MDEIKNESLTEKLNEETVQSRPKKKESSDVGIGSFVWELFKILVISMVIIIPFRLYVAEPFIVSGYSMVPNFHDREYLVVNKAGYLMHEPTRGDVVVLKYPKNEKEYFIKRIVGLPGETVRVSQGKVIVINSQYPDGHTLDETYLPEGLLTTGGMEELTLKEDEFYVLGDNRGASLDSRVWGVLPKKDIVGKAFIRVLPLSKFSIFSYNDPIK